MDRFCMHDVRAFAREDEGVARISEALCTHETVGWLGGMPTHSDQVAVSMKEAAP